MSEYRTKVIKVYDPTLMSGSVDTFRTTIGAGLRVTTDKSPRNKYGTFIVRAKPAAIKKLADSNKYLKNKSKYQPSPDSNSNNMIRNLAMISSTNVGMLDNIRYDSDNVVPVIRYSGRIYGSAENIENDMHWDAFINGGVYMDTEYDGMFMDAEYYDHWFKYEMPLTSLEVERFKQKRKASPIMDEINIGYEYNRYFKRYERYAGSLPDEKLIPNLYTLQMFSEADDLKFDRQRKKAFAQMI